MIPHTVTDPACLYYAGPSLDRKPRWRDWLLHPRESREWHQHDRARGVACAACRPSFYRIRP